MREQIKECSRPRYLVTISQNELSCQATSTYILLETNCHDNLKDPETSEVSVLTASVRTSLIYPPQPRLIDNSSLGVQAGGVDKDVKDHSPGLSPLYWICIKALPTAAPGLLCSAQPLSQHPANTQPHPANTQLTPSQHPANTQPTPSQHPANRNEHGTI